MQTHKLFGCLIAAVSICHSAEYLAAIRDLPSGMSREYHVIKQIETEYIAIVGDGELRRLQSERIAVTVLDTGPRAKAYYLIANSGANHPELLRLGRVLKRYDLFFLFQTTEKRREEMLGVPVRMERLHDTPVTLGDLESSNQPRVPTVPNPEIERILKEISIDTLRGYVKKLQSFKTRHASTTENKTVVCPWLASVLRPFCDSVYLQPVGSYGPNVVGIKKGNSSSSLTKYCLIGAHLDAVVKNGPFGAAGADDNGTGTAGVLECARVFKNHSFVNTVLFVLFNAEEVGLVGSEQMAKEMKNKGDTVIGGVVTYDQAGHSSSSTKEIIWLEGVGNTDPKKTFITSYLQGIVDTYIHMKTQYSLQGAGTDYASFSDEGYIAGMVGQKEWNHPAYHQVFDTLDCPNGLNDMHLFENIIKTGTAAIADMAIPLTTAVCAGQRTREEFFTEARFDRTRGGVLRIAVSRACGRAFDIELCSVQGKVVWSPGPVCFGEATTVSLPLSRHGGPLVSNGIYCVRVTNGAIRRTHPIVVSY